MSEMVIPVADFELLHDQVNELRKALKRIADLGEGPKWAYLDEHDAQRAVSIARAALS